MQHVSFPVLAIHEGGHTYACVTPEEIGRLMAARLVWDVGTKHRHTDKDRVGRPRVTLHPWVLRDDDGRPVDPQIAPLLPGPRRDWCPKRRGCKHDGRRSRRLVNKREMAAMQCGGDWPEHEKAVRQVVGPRNEKLALLAEGCGDRWIQRSWKEQRRTQWKRDA